MAKYQIEHTCGHTVVHQITGPTKDRPRREQWLAEQACEDCRKAAFNATTAAAAEQVADGDLPTLTGSEKQINWARTIRAEKIGEIQEWAESSLAKLRDQQSPNLAIAQGAWHNLRKHHNASWWIENRTRSGQSLLQDELALIRPAKTPTPDQIAAAKAADAEAELARQHEQQERELAKAAAAKAKQDSEAALATFSVASICKVGDRITAVATDGRKILAWDTEDGVILSKSEMSDDCITVADWGPQATRIEREIAAMLNATK